LQRSKNHDGEAYGAAVAAYIDYLRDYFAKSTAI
jgi:hypothetical protein